MYIQGANVDWTLVIGIKGQRDVNVVSGEKGEARQGRDCASREALDAGEQVFRTDAHLLPSYVRSCH